MHIYRITRQQLIDWYNKVKQHQLDELEYESAEWKDVNDEYNERIEALGSALTSEDVLKCFHGDDFHISMCIGFNNGPDRVLKHGYAASIRSHGKDVKIFVTAGLDGEPEYYSRGSLVGKPKGGSWIVDKTSKFYPPGHLNGHQSVKIPKLPMIRVTESISRVLEANAPMFKKNQLVKMNLLSGNTIYRKLIDVDKFGNAKAQTVTLKPNSNRIDGYGSVEILTAKQLSLWKPVMGRS